ncbi:MAG: peptidoglycan-binding protein, partial [Jatrophihabitantaceae bacterium]
VRTVQYLLRARAYSLSTDGAFGPITASTVRSFQSARGLAVDGIVGPQTWEALVITVRRGSVGDAVRAAQSQLNAHGFSLSVDGAFGLATDSAARSFQSRVGLSVDGIVGPDTWSRLVA